MWFKGWKTLLAAALLGMMAFAGAARATNTWYGNFHTAYPAAVGSRIDSCLLCHVNANASPSTRNSYGSAYGSANHNFKTIEPLDSDVDTFTNLDEITKFFFPGNAADHPVAAADTTPPTVTAFTLPATATSLTVSVSSLTATDAVGVTAYLLTESATKPLSTAAGWLTVKPASYTFAAAGAHTLYAWAKDAAGNVSTSLNAAVTITLPDTTPPTVTAFTLPATAASLTVSVSSFTATDAVGVTAYLLTETAPTPLSTAAGWLTVKPTTYTFATAGVKNLYAWAKDAAGNVSTSLSATVTITLPDTTPPTVTAFTLPATAASLTVSVSSLTATDAVGVTAYLLTESATKPLSTAAGWLTVKPGSYTFAAAGAHTLYAWAKDAAGNVSTSLSAAVTITLADTTPPSVTAFTLPATAASLTVSVSSFTATDAVGVAAYLLNESATKPLAADAGWLTVKPTSYTFATAGAHTLYAWAKDAAGNVSTSLSAAVTITLADTTPPTVTAFTLPATAASLTVSVSSFTATDAVGVAAYLLNESATKPLAADAGWLTVKPTSYAFATAGAHTLYAWAKDAAGNVSTSLSASVTITLPDTTPPAVTTFLLPATAASLTVSVSSFTATDGVGVTAYLLTESATKPLATAAGWLTVKPTTYTFAAAGAHTLYAWAKDAAGNVSTSISSTVTITLADTTPPTVTAFTLPATAASLTVSVSSFTATDAVGVTAYLLTETAPTPLSTDAGWLAAKPASYTFAAAGAHTLYAWAKDAAGNVSTSLNAAVTITLALPTVTITASVPTTTEGSPTPGAFAVRRTGDTTAALTVEFTVVSTANPGSDYVPLDTAVTIPPGATTGTISVTSLNNSACENSETVVVTLSASAAYAVGSPGSATVTILEDGDCTQSHPAAKNDFDGDGRSDIGCYYPPGGNWYGFGSTDGFWQAQLGYAGTVPVTGDFDGDGTTDIGSYDPESGSWNIQKSRDGSWQTQFGYAGTIPVVGDFDGDGRDDIGCYYPQGGNWYILQSTGGFLQTQFGYAGTIPVVGDFDGDGRDDIGCYYPPGGNWYVLKSTEGFWQTQFGYAGTIPVVGDFDGDGRDDIGCYYPQGGNWYVSGSTKGFWQTQFGYAGTEPVVGDFDGDGRDDFGCYYPQGGNWYVLKSAEGFWQTKFGYEGTIPLGGTLR